MNGKDTDFDNIVDQMRNDLGEDLNFITITLNPKLYKYQAITQYEIVHNELVEKMRLFEKFAMSVELTNNGNIHYHAIVKSTDKLNRVTFYNKIKKLRKIGRTHTTPQPIDTMDQLKRSALYLIKDVDVTRKVLHTNNYKPHLLICE